MELCTLCDPCHGIRNSSKGWLLLTPTVKTLLASATVQNNSISLPKSPRTDYWVKCTVIAWLFIPAARVLEGTTTFCKQIKETLACSSPFKSLVPHALIWQTQTIFNTWNKVLLLGFSLRVPPAALLQTVLFTPSNIHLPPSTILLCGSWRLFLEAFLLKPCLPYLSDTCLPGSVLTPLGFGCAPRWIISRLLEFTQGTP